MHLIFIIVFTYQTLGIGLYRLLVSNSFGFNISKIVYIYKHRK